MRVRLDEQATHGGGEVSATVQTDETVVGNGHVETHAFAGSLFGDEDEPLQVPGFQTFEDVVGDHVEVVCCILAIHLLHQLRLRLHTDHRVLILAGEKLWWGEMKAYTSDM